MIAQRWHPATHPLSDRQRAILLHLAKHSPATIRELGTAVGLRSSSTTWNHVRWLKRLGLVTYQPMHSRTLCLAPDVAVSERGLVYKVVPQDPDSYGWKPAS